MNRLKLFFDKFYRNFVSKLRLDHVLHAYVSTCLMIIFFGLSDMIFHNIWIAGGVSFALVTLIGYLKEKLIDEKIRKGNPEIGDFWADLVGNAIGAVLVICTALIVLHF